MGNNTVIYIKNMVCNRCIRVVKEELGNAGIVVKKVELGSAELENEPSKETLKQIAEILISNGFGLLDDRKKRIIGQIKTLIIGLVQQYYEIDRRINLSDYLSLKTGLDYSYLSNLFSSAEGITIEKYLINQKIEKVRELLAYEELTLSEIAYKLGYSSPQHLSSQFKKITGMSPTDFKNQKVKKRTPLDFV